MKHYQLRIEPTDGREPATWSGDAICFLDACIKARRMFDESLGENHGIAAVRSFTETGKMIALLPLVVISG